MYITGVDVWCSHVSDGRPTKLGLSVCADVLVYHSARAEASFCIVIRVAGVCAIEHDTAHVGVIIWNMPDFWRWSPSSSHTVVSKQSLRVSSDHLLRVLETVAWVRTMDLCTGKEMGVRAVRSYHDNVLESPLQVVRSHANGSVSWQQKLWFSGR